MIAPFSFATSIFEPHRTFSVFDERILSYFAVVGIDSPATWGGDEWGGDGGEFSSTSGTKD